MAKLQKRRKPTLALTASQRYAVRAYLDRSWPGLTKRQASQMLNVLERQLTIEPLSSEELGFTAMKDPTMAVRRKVGAVAISVGGIVSTAYGLKSLAATVAITIAGISIPILPFALMGAALTVLKEAKSFKGERLHEDEALALWTLWMECDEHKWVNADGFVETLNKQRQIYARPPLASPEINNVLRGLEKTGIIETTHSPRGWNLRESVRVL